MVYRLSVLSMEPVRMSSRELASTVVMNFSCACTIPLGPALRRGEWSGEMQGERSSSGDDSFRWDRGDEHEWAIVVRRFIAGLLGRV